MKRLRKTVSLLLLISLCSAPLTSCKRETLKKYETSLPIISDEDIKYSDGFIKSEAQKLYTALENTIHKIYGSTLPYSISLLKRSFENALLAFDERGISEEKVKTITELILNNESCFEELIIAAKENDALPIDGALKLFGNFSRYIGANNTSLFLYDVLLIYCEYMEDKYTELYMKNPELSYLFSSAVEWQGKYKRVQNIGEENFALTLRALVSLSSVKNLTSGSEGNFALTISGGELAVFLNTEGEMLSKTNFTKDDIIFILDELGKGGGIELFKAIRGAGDIDRCASICTELLPLIADMLKNATPESANELLEADISSFLYHLTRDFDDKDWNVLERLASGENEEKYIAYFTKQKQIKEYLSFKAEAELTELSELKNASKENFFEIFEAYISYSSPALAFTVFSNDQGK